MHVTYLSLEALREGQASYVHVHEIIAGLKKQGVDVTLYDPAYSFKAQSPALIVRILIALYLQAKLWAGWKKGSVLYMRVHYMAFFSTLIAKMFKIPVFLEINGPYYEIFVTYPVLNFFKPLIVPMVQWQFRYVDGLTAVTKNLQRWANQIGRRNDCAYISNGVNTDYFKPDLPRPHDVPDKYVVFFGGLTRWHSIPTLLEAATLPQWPQDIKLVIIGDGQETALVQEAAQKNSLLCYLGKKPYKEIAPYIANAMAGLVTINSPERRSLTGVMPLKLFETLASGIPAIVTDVTGQADFIRDHQCGVVIPVDDPIALAKAVTNLKENEMDSHYLKTTIRDMMVEEHSWQKRAEQTLDFIKEKNQARAGRVM